MISYSAHDETGVIHAVSTAGDSEYTMCGKPASIFWNHASGPATCGTCLKSLNASRDYRVARDLTDFCRELLADVDARPGAYIHADRQTLGAIRAALENLDIEREQP